MASSARRSQLVHENELFYGDNLKVLAEHVADESVDLVNLDPPFKSNVEEKDSSPELTTLNRSPRTACLLHVHVVLRGDTQLCLGPYSWEAPSSASRIFRLGFNR